MLSLAQHHYSPMFSPLPSDLRSSYSGSPHSSTTSQRIQTSGLESMVTGNQFSLQSPNKKNGVGPSVKSPTRARHHPYDGMDNGKPRDARQRNDDGGPVRRRISRACDQCNQLRTKCDGMTPCAHCVEFSLACEYFRERKKRGKASRKDIAAQQAAAAAAASQGGGHGNQPASPAYSSEDPSSATSNSNQAQEALKGSRSDLPPPPLRRPGPPGRAMSNSDIQSQSSLSHDLTRTDSVGMLPEHVHMSQNAAQAPRSHMPEDLQQMNGFDLVPEYQRQQMGMSAMHQGPQGDLHGHVMQHIPQQLDTTNSFHYGDPSFQLMSPHDAPPNGFPAFGRPLESPIANFMAPSPVASSPGWLALPSPSSGNFGNPGITAPPSTLRYPVLQPLIPKLSSIIPNSLACDLLELYFASSSSAHMHPLSPYVLGFVFRKRSFLHHTRPRACSPSLLASMLWVSAQTSDAPFLTSPPQARGRICQKLLELTVSLLRPLIHGSGDGAPTFGTNTVVNGVALGGLGVAINIDQLTSETGGSGTLDDVATYLHLATVISASEHKAASMRWWNVAWSLARELKLGRELPLNAPQRDADRGEEQDAEGDVDLEMTDGHINGLPQNGSPSYSEEEREERRRIWWLLYTVDRHLALCYNRPLFLLDVECSDLLQPVGDSTWQSDEFFTNGTTLFPDPASGLKPRHRGPSYECTSHSIFGFFTPLMTILGEVVELNQARNHPRFGLAFRSASEWDSQTAEITQHLEMYGRSLAEFEARTTASLHAEQEADRAAAAGEVGTPSVRSVRSANTSSSRIIESVIQTKIVKAYGTHVMHVLHILLTGKWDPISLLDDSDLWISSESFIFATQHAVSGAEAVSEILEYDPDLSFMPFFFGIYLLQGSFLLLLIADKLQGEASQSVVGACEVVVRAVEACVVTLNTEYQRNFRKVLRSALAQVKGRIPEDFGEQQQRRREVLSLYRWTGDGTGLAL